VRDLCPALRTVAARPLTDGFLHRLGADVRSDRAWDRRPAPAPQLVPRGGHDGGLRHAAARPACPPAGQRRGKTHRNGEFMPVKRPGGLLLGTHQTWWGAP